MHANSGITYVALEDSGKFRLVLACGLQHEFDVGYAESLSGGRDILGGSVWEKGTAGDTKRQGSQVTYSRSFTGEWLQNIFYGKDAIIFVRNWGHTTRSSFS